eukprot:3486081-Alexandrium_andersonii.AAC.1
MGAHEVQPVNEELANRFTPPPNGPDSAADLFCYPLAIVRRLFDGDTDMHRSRISAMHEILRQGVKASSDYSGMDCPREAFRLANIALEMVLGKVPYPRPLGGGQHFFQMCRACDVGSTQCKVLIKLATSDEPSTCVFRDLQDRLPSVAKQEIASILEAATTDDELVAAYRDVNTFLQRNAK